MASRGYISADEVVRHAREIFLSAGEGFGRYREAQVRMGAEQMSQGLRAIARRQSYEGWVGLAGDSAQINPRTKRNPFWYGS